MEFGESQTRPSYQHHPDSMTPFPVIQWPSSDFLFSSSSSVCTHACLHACVCVCVQYTCPCKCLWRSIRSALGVFLHHPHLTFETGSPTHLELPVLARGLASKSWHPFYPECLDYKHAHMVTLGFSMVAGDQNLSLHVCAASTLTMESPPTLPLVCSCSM